MTEPSPTEHTISLPSVATVNARLKSAVENRLRGEVIAVRGIAWDVRHTQKGHTFFHLRQDRQALSCAVLRRLARLLDFRIEDGQVLSMQGHIEVSGWGELQVVAHEVVLEQSAPTRETLSELRARAQAEGWLDPRRKRPLPHPPQVIGLITGESSRAYRDVTGSLVDAGIEAQVIPYYVLLTGPDTALQSRAAIESLNAREGVDLIVIARGGAHRPSDLAAFNDWDLARTIVVSHVPVVTAIGHCQDRCLADLVADRAVPTPSSVGQEIARTHVSVGSQEVAIIVAVGVILVIVLVVLARVFGWTF